MSSWEKIIREQSPELFKKQLDKVTKDVVAGRPQSQQSWNEENDLNRIFLSLSYFFSRLNALTHTEISYIQRQQDSLPSCGQIHQQLEQKQGRGVLKNPFFNYQETPWFHGRKSMLSFSACS